MKVSKRRAAQLREAGRRYRQTAKGRAAKARYVHSELGVETRHANRDANRKSVPWTFVVME